MLACEMKAQGVYISRGLSYRGAAFRLVDATLGDAQRAQYDAAAALWLRLKRQLATAEVLARECAVVYKVTTGTGGRVGADGCARGTWTAYWSSHQRFFKQLCIAGKVPAVVQEAELAARGRTGYRLADDWRSGS